MSGDGCGGQGGYRVVAIAMKEASIRRILFLSLSLSPSLLLWVKKDKEIASALALERLIEVGGWPRALSFSTLLGNAL